MTRLGLLALLAISASAQSVGDRSVYIMPMAGGWDQYLAGQIAREHVMQVVADPKIADVVMTDSLNETLTQTLAKLHPKEDRDAADVEVPHTFHKSGSKGTLFLVDAKSRQVIWSDYEKPARNVSAGRLNRAAERVVKKMQGALGK